MIFQILDANYVYDGDGFPVVQLFGTTPEGKPATVKVSGFLPYFYARVDEKRLEEAIEGMRAMDLEAEVVERFRPVGYQKTPQRMLKVIAKDPKSVRVYRENVLSVSGVLEVYETDVLFKNRFLIDQDLGGMRWAKVEELVTEGPVPFTSLQPVEAGDNNLKSRANAPLRHLAFDIECLPLHGAMPNPENSPVIMVSLGFYPPYKGQEDLVLVGREVDCPRSDVLCCSGEREMLARFIEILKDYDPDVIAGYNSNEFDFPYLEERMKRLNLDARVGRDRSPWRLRKIVNQTRVEITGRIVVDLLPLVRSSFSLKRYTLRNASFELLGVEKHDVEPKEMEALWAASGEEFARLVSYSRRDSYLALHLLLDLKLLDKYIALAQTSGSLLQDVIDGGQTGMVENFLFRKFQERRRVIPPKPDTDLSSTRAAQSFELKGGAVLEPRRGLVEDVVILDYRSLYPSIMMAHNLCYSTVVIDDRPPSGVLKSPSGGEFVDPSVSPGIVPGVLSDLLDQRTDIKRRMKAADDEDRTLLDAQQYALKILLNSFYGYSGYARARLYSLPLANAVTSFGRSNILNTKAMVEEIGSIYVKDGQALLPAEMREAAGDSFPAAGAGEVKKFDLSVVYGDTDSVFVRLKPHGEHGAKPSLGEAELVGGKIAETVTSRLPPPMELVFEAFARRGLFLVKKRYALWVFEKVGMEWRDKIKVRGMETVRRDWCELTSKTLNRCLELVLQEGKVDEAVELARSVIDRLQRLDLQNDSEILDDLILTRRYTKSSSAYKNKQPHVQLAEKMRARGGPIPSVGDRVPFVILRGKGLFVDRAEDPSYSLENDLKIDTDYYIEKQILPPLLRLLSPFGVSREQLVCSPEQQRLFDLEPIRARGAKGRPSTSSAGAPGESSDQKSLFDF
ncbi:MAG: DNA-directed DNA polymerase [Methanothrix sp.]|jgi:DNA polymerase I|uniref:DNA polymerase n=1 Tax=Methanothrix harundinacea TaxID=301375 RepID=A0A101II83_9EURY|nr:MAG: DNA polymerase [Methanothrix harundinacea]MDD2637643.1 DNA-directed DNA polymerase [Methanothrix sp.]MDI9398822.1 DNA-directed DNA polymerase [Euryarchaeota archaeon]KUK95701.1 MAG: DNA polymerase [Methanothrix harundinacea]MCP1392575.1 DNA polymerase elongation subunit [Methanothrix harundinacea]